MIGATVRAGTGMMRTRVIWRWLMAGAIATIAVPALADIKAGVEAWNRGDYARAVAEWRGPALAGDPDAEYNMGQAYKLGRGVPADLPQAESWYQKAAAQGHTMAQDNYGLALFQDGRKGDALPWLEKSAARDEKRAELVLGTMLFNGDAVPKDWVRAYALVNRSSQQGLAEGSKALAQMDGYLSPEQRQQGIALATRTADQGRSAQMAALANPSTVRGIGGPTGPSPAPVRAEATPHAGRPASGSIATADLPPSSAPKRLSTPGTRGMPPTDAGPSPAAAAKPKPERHVAAATTLPRDKPLHSRPAVATGGHWRVQLGAFRDDGNAHALWAKVAGRVGGQPSYAKAGGVTRLQAGPFATKADAERACHAAGSSCVVVP